MVTNRAKIVAAARVSFAERGLNTPLEPIAKSAGVGNTTLYCHFPRDALWDAVFSDRLREVLDAIDQAFAKEDAFEGIAHYLTGSREIESADGGFTALMTTRYTRGTQLAGLRSQAQNPLDTLIARALDTRVIRPDVTETDFASIATALSSVAHATSSVAPQTWLRLLGILLDGLRPAIPTPLLHPSFTKNQVWRAFAGPAPVR